MILQDLYFLVALNKGQIDIEYSMEKNINENNNSLEGS